MWEKNSNDGSIHDFTNFYTRSRALLSARDAGGERAESRTPTPVSFTARRRSLPCTFGTTFVMDGTNCMAGCTVTICSCTQPALSFPYWSSTTNGAASDVAFLVRFSNGEAINRYDRKLWIVEPVIPAAYPPA
jgi:hypothetical protein